MQLRAYVLHLARATARRDNAHQLLETCGVASEIWPAIDGSALSQDERTRDLRPHLFDPPYPFPLRPGEIGVFLSQRAIWAEIARGQADAGLILEDDARLDPETFARALALAKRHIDHIGYIQFQTRQPKPGGIIDHDGDLVLSVPTETPVRATAQLISRSAAEHLVAKAQTFDRPVDTFVQSHWFTGLRPGVIYPSGVAAISDQLDGSTIQIGRKSRLGRLQREIARFRYRRAISRAAHTSTAPAPDNAA